MKDSFLNILHANILNERREIIGETLKLKHKGELRNDGQKFIKFLEL